MLSAILILCTGLFVIVERIRAPDIEVDRIEKLIVEIKQTDAQWSLDVQKLEMGLNGNYDPVTFPLPRLKSYYEQIRRLTETHKRDDAQGAALQGLLQLYKATMDRKTSLVEKIKSQYAILNNSSRFLPAASVNLLAAINGSDMDPAEQMRIKDLLSAILSKTMSDTLLRGAPLEEAIDQDTATLAKLADGSTAALADEARAFITHVGLILKERQAGIQMLVELTSLPTGRVLDDLRDQYAQDQADIQLRQRLYIEAFISVAALLAAILAYLGWRLFRDYRQLNQTNSQLQHDNEETQSQLIHTAKMSALGNMVAGVAHEINTPLAYVKAVFSVLQDLLSSTVARAQDPRHFAELLLARKTGDGPAAEDTIFEDINVLLTDGLHGVDQIAALVIAMKNFSRLDRDKSGEFSLAELMDNALLITRYSLKYTVAIEKDYAKIPPVSCSPSQISQVFLNIITNAAQAMPERSGGGAIRIKMARHGEGMVRIDIADNGIGIPNDILSKIFDPFFTTKSVREGSGMGLSICYRIIRNHGGQITVHSQEGVGSTFSIVLPIASADAVPLRALEHSRGG